MRRSVLALTVPAAVLAAAPVRAEPVVIQPSTKWHVDFAENKCRLARLFGEGEDQHLLFFEQYWPGERFGLTVAGPSLDRFRSRERTELQFFEAQTPHRTEPFTGTIEPYGGGVVYSTVDIIAGTNASKDDSDTDEDDGPRTSLPALDMAAAAQVEFVSVRQRGKVVRLQTGPLSDAFTVLNGCSLDLISSWGLDVEAHRTATRLPYWTNAKAVISKIVATYPRSALLAGEQGIMRMRVIISPQGTVEDCVIIKATDTEKLESPACRAMQAAQFEPALDAAGQPMRSYFAESIVYQVGR